MNGLTVQVNTDLMEVPTGSMSVHREPTGGKRLTVDLAPNADDEARLRFEQLVTLALTGGMD